MTHIANSFVEQVTKRIVTSAGFLTVLLLLNACAPLPAPPTTEPQALTKLPGWLGDDLQDLHGAIQFQCTYVVRTPARFHAKWPKLCADLPSSTKQPNTTVFRAWLETNFTARLQYGPPEQGKDPSITGTLTGYYEPLVQASKTATADYRFALYKKPKDLLTLDLASVYPALRNQRVRGRIDSKPDGDASKVVPYYSRAEIESRGVLAGNELLFLNDRADAFFLEIQGSGRARLPDGSILRIGYADQNGHPYRAIGRLLIDTGEIPRENMSALAIKQWIRANPEKADTVLHTNASQVFFRELPLTEANKNNPDLGPPGSLGIPLTPMRSIATDPRHIALGSLVWIQGKTKTTVIQRLALAQDTGGAITGPVRADLFTGYGTAAEELASGLNASLNVFLLEPR